MISDKEYVEVFPCVYFSDGRVAKNVFIPVGTTTKKEFSELLAKGYRRTGPFFYRNQCENCSACIPIRIDVESFKPGKSQRRTISKNKDVLVVHKIYEKAEPRITTKKLSLYQRYVTLRHNQKDIEHIIALNSLHYGFYATREIDFFIDKRLVGVSVIDEAEDAFSSNYFYYEPSLYKRRLGIFSILEEIKYCIEEKKKWLYLGFWIKELSKMAYKAEFKPYECYINGEWVRFFE